MGEALERIYAVLSSNQFGYTSDVQRYEYNLYLAKKLLAEAASQWVS